MMASAAPDSDYEAGDEVLVAFGVGRRRWNPGVVVETKDSAVFLSTSTVVRVRGDDGDFETFVHSPDNIRPMPISMRLARRSRS